MHFGGSASRQRKDYKQSERGRPGHYSRRGHLHDRGSGNGPVCGQNGQGKEKGR